jgi:uncharacterized protein
VSFYLDTNVIVAILTPEPFSDRAERFARANPDGLLVGDFAAAEYVSVIARRVRMRELPLDEARDALTAFDFWRSRSARTIRTTAPDVATAETYLRRLDLPLLTPDAIHIALAQRLGATLVTFDRAMAASARVLGMAVTTP